MENRSANIFIPAQWSEAADSIALESSPPPVALICGPKNSGKSTFSRYLLNCLLLSYEKVAYLDTDVGQPEFTPPGCLSLTIIDKVTPDFTIPCLKTPERCYFYGDISSKLDSTGYLNCISALYGYYRKEHQVSSKDRGQGRIEVPLIVNTPGWVKGQGYDVLFEMLRFMAPTHVVKINISVESKNLPAGEFWLNIDDDDENVASINLIEICSARKDSRNRSVLVRKEAQHIRDQRLMAYFRKCFPSDMNLDTIKELANALARHPPYQVNISSIKIKHLHCQISSTEVLYALNATVVGLAVSSGEHESLPVCVGLGMFHVLNSHLYPGILCTVCCIVLPVNRAG